MQLLSCIMLYLEEIMSLVPLTVSLSTEKQHDIERRVLYLIF